MHLPIAARRPRRLRVAGTLVAASLALGALAGCASDTPTPASAVSPAGCTSVAPGQGSESVTATGGFDKEPKVSFPSPLHVSQTQVSTLIAGHGTPIIGQQEIVADVTILDGSTGAVVSKTPYTTKADAATFTVSGIPLAGLKAGLVCAKVGERRAVVIPPGKGFTSANRPSGVAAGDTIVVVADIRQAYLAKANGTPQVMSSGLPQVVLAPNGRPGITIPANTPAPTTTQVDMLRDGSGARIESGDSVVVQYTGVLWKGGTVFDSSWASGAPATLSLKKGQIIEGFRKALIGKRVGSQVLAILAPSDAYGKTGTSDGSIPANATLVFVVDILGKA